MHPTDPRPRRRRPLATLTAAAATAGLLLGPVLAAAPAVELRPARWDGVVRAVGEHSVDVGTDAAALAVARAALADAAPAIGVDPDRFAFELVQRSDLGVHVRGRELRAGVPVLDSSAAVHVVDGRVWQVEARPSPLPGRPAGAAIDADAATASALAHLGVLDGAPGEDLWHEAERFLVADAGRLRDLWRVHVVALAGVATTVHVDAASGEVVGTVDERRFLDGTAEVFDPNPVVRLQDHTIRQPGLDLWGVDTDLPAFAEARTTLAVLEVDAAQLQRGRLLGPWVDVRAAAPIALGASGELELDFGREDPRFEAAMAYAHLDRLQRWFRQDLGLSEVNAEPQLVVAVPVPGFDNSFYSGGNDLILLGSGGVDDGEDAEVIVHEYGHAVHDAQVPGWGRDPEGGAMGEGFGDFLAAAYYARGISEGFQDTCVADWDATSYSDASPPCLRRTDTGKRWPDDRTGGVHADGEVWSQYLWRLREALGSGTGADAERRRSDRTMRLLLSSHWFLTPRATFADAVAALESAAVALGDGTAVPIVRREAQRIGFTAP